MRGMLQILRRKVLHPMAGHRAGGNPKDRMRKTGSHSAVPLEHAEQVGFVNWFRAKFPHILIFAVPNGDHRAITTAKRLKAEGVVAGVPDLCIPQWNMWVEMKRREGGRLSEDQREIIAHLQAIGHHVIVGKGAEDASRQLLGWLENKGG